MDPADQPRGREHHVSDNVSPAGSVLIVDDDALVGQVIASHLRHLGYAAVQTVSVRKAEQLLPEVEKLSFIVCDVVMPELSGPELIQRLAATHAPLRVMFVSGYEMEELEDEKFPGVVHVCLDKPFSITTFRSAVDRLLALELPHDGGVDAANGRSAE